MRADKKHISNLINILRKNKEPIFVDRYAWSCSNEVSAMKWLSHKKFLRYKIDGRYFKIYRSKYFYDILDKTKLLSEDGIIKFLKTGVEIK